jgi:UrcA family protein
MKITILAAAIAASSCLATGATAQPYGMNDTSATEIVSYADLHLASMRDRDRLEWRLEAAASRLCAEDTRATPTFSVNTSCYRAALASAHRQMDRAIAWAKGGPSLVLAPR